MAYKYPNCRLCRREGEKLFLKGARCQSQKCALVRKGYAPGDHGAASKKGKPSSYAIQLREKQKTKRIYGLREGQFFKYYSLASKKKGVTGLVLLQLLETRLDNIIFRLGWAPSRHTARQVVSHDHIQVNGHTVNIPSYQVKIGDKITVKESSKTKKYFKETLDLGDFKPPIWLKTNSSALTGEIITLPSKDDIDSNINEQLIIEFYSR